MDDLPANRLLSTEEPPCSPRVGFGRFGRAVGARHVTTTGSAARSSSPSIGKRSRNVPLPWLDAPAPRYCLPPDSELTRQLTNFLRVCGTRPSPLRASRTPPGPLAAKTSVGERTRNARRRHSEIEVGSPLPGSSRASRAGSPSSTQSDATPGGVHRPVSCQARSRDLPLSGFFLSHLPIENPALCGQDEVQPLVTGPAFGGKWIAARSGRRFQRSVPRFGLTPIASRSRARSPISVGE